MKSLIYCLLLLVNPHVIAATNTYDPSQPKFAVNSSNIVFGDQKKVASKLYFPEEQKNNPVILFSHGLGGSKEGSAYLGKHWASRGYVVVFIQHTGSDNSVWQGKNKQEAISALKGAASVEQLRQRLQDVEILLSELHKENYNKNSVLYGRLDSSKIGMSGHSFGAKTAQAVSGEQPYKMLPITAAILMSPSPSRYIAPAVSFGKVPIPWLCMTGTNDGSPKQIINTLPSDRRKVFDALPMSGDMYELVLNNAEHSAFTEHAVDKKRNPNHHAAILAVSSAFWDAYLSDSKEAKDWLVTSPKTVLEINDIWQSK